MTRVLVSLAAGALAIAAAGCGTSTTTVTSTVVTVVKTAAAPATDVHPPASAPASATTTPAVTAPDVVGQRLDVAELHLRARHIRYREVGGGTFGIIVKSNWTVCEQEPAAGAAHPGRVNLIVDREC